MHKIHNVIVKSLITLMSVGLFPMIISCYRDPPEVVAIKKAAEAPYKEQNVSYWKDNRTNLCFAYAWGGGDHIYGGNGDTGALILTNVPCSPEVEKLLTFAPESLHKAN